MAKRRDRTCISCGEVEYNTRTPSDICLLCVKENKRQADSAVERETLSFLYTDIEGPEYDEHKHRNWTFVHAECGTKQTWVFNNVMSRLQKDIDSTPCTKCGKKRRAAAALAGYLKNNARDYDLTVYADYQKKVRGLSEKTYNMHIDTINPERHVRMLGNQGHHLDHIVSIIDCFKAGFSVETAASLPNLRILEAGVNMTKGRRSDDEVFQILLEKEMR